LKKIIIFVLHELSIGGSQRVLVNLANAFVEEGYIVHFCLFKKRGELLQNLHKEVIIHDLNSTRVLTGVFSYFSLIYQLKPNVVFTGITHVNIITSLLIPFFRLFYVNSIFVSRESNNPSIRAKYLKKSKRLDFVYTKTISNFDLIIAQSKFMRTDLINAYDLNGNNVIVVNNPLDYKSVQIKAIERIEEKFIHSNKINIVSVGGLRYQKGFDLLLNVVKASKDDYHFHIVGEGAEREKISQLILEAKIQDKVTIHGSRKNPYKYIYQADLVVLSSRYEGFPNVILEANACGKFVIAFKSPGVDDEIITEGLNGSLVDFKDYSSFLKKIDFYSSSGTDKEAIFSSVKKYDSKKIAERYINLFDNYKI